MRSDQKQCLEKSAKLSLFSFLKKKKKKITKFSPYRIRQGNEFFKKPTAEQETVNVTE